MRVRTRGNKVEFNINRTVGVLAVQSVNIFIITFMAKGAAVTLTKAEAVIKMFFVLTN